MARESVVRIAAGDVVLDADLAIPDRTRGLVLFAHGSGSSRRSPRNRMVAEQLREAGLGTVLADLLTVDEEGYDRATGALRFNIELLAGRLVGAIDWLRQQPRTEELPLGLFGASTGAAAALAAAAHRPADIDAVVSRGGRPDLAASCLAWVRAPVLLVVGSRDEQVLELNRRAAALLRAERALYVVPAATHLFEEPGALEQVGQVAVEWFDRYLARGGVAAATMSIPATGLVRGAKTSYR
jgi:putative phosphoribosyl transferase